MIVMLLSLVAIGIVVPCFIRDVGPLWAGGAVIVALFMPEVIAAVGIVSVIVAVVMVTASSIASATGDDLGT